MTRARRGWTANRIRAIRYYVAQIDACLAAVRADLSLSGDESTIDGGVGYTWPAAKGMLLSAPDRLREKRAEDERTRERRRGPSPKTPAHWKK